jgi:GNAT superfamily N-acetyltransferase
MNKTINYETKIQQLDLSHLGQVMNLINTNVSTFGRRYHYKHTQEFEWKDFLSREDYAVFGAFKDGALIGIGSVYFPMDGQNPYRAEFDTKVTDTKIAIFKSGLVDKSYRSNGVIGHIHNARRKEALHRRCVLAITKIAKDNPRSLERAKSFGFIRRHESFDQVDKKNKVFLELWLREKMRT